MTVAVIIAGLLPVLWGTGAGSEVMSRIVAPMIGGMITAPLLSLFIIPAAYKAGIVALRHNVCRPPAASNCRRVQHTFIVRVR